MFAMEPTVALASCDPGPGQAAFYVDSQYRGACVVRGRGDYPNSGAIGLPNDSISSIRLGPNARVSICRDNDFKGDCIAITNDTPLLGGKRVGNDTISSLQVQPANAQACAPNDDQVAFFEHADFQGRCAVRGYGNYPDPSDLGIANDTMSSALVGRNAEAIVCTDSNYRFDCIRLTGNTPLLSNTGSRRFNDQISSAKVVHRGVLECSLGAQRAAFFMHADFIGPCVVLGLGESPNAGGLGGQGISSVLVAPGTRVCLYATAQYSPLIGEITANMPYMGSANDKTVAVRVQAGSSRCVAGLQSSAAATVPSTSGSTATIHPVVTLTIESDPKNALSTGGLHVHGTGFARNDAIRFVVTSRLGDANQAPETSPPMQSNSLGVADYYIFGANGVCSDTQRTSFTAYGYGTRDTTRSPVSTIIACGGNRP